jgi:hypothetical protein
MAIEYGGRWSQFFSLDSLDQHMKSASICEGRLLAENIIANLPANSLTSLKSAGPMALKVCAP